MKAKKRIIFTLLYESGNFVLSRNFRLQSIGNYDWLQKNYNFSNVSYHIDELVILDVTRENRNKNDFSNIVKKISENIFVPLTVGGGINSIEDAKLFFQSGADKVSINSYLFNKKNLAKEICNIYGKQCLVGSLDIKKENNEYLIYTNNGNNLVFSIDRFFKQNEICENIGELYINSINQDGTGNGLDFRLANIVNKKSSIPFIIAGGIGKIEDIKDSFKSEFIDALSTAHLLNFIGESLKNARILCKDNGISLASWPNIDQIF